MLGLKVDTIPTSCRVLFLRQDLIFQLIFLNFTFFYQFFFSKGKIHQGGVKFLRQINMTKNSTGPPHSRPVSSARPIMRSYDWGCKRNKKVIACDRPELRLLQTNTHGESINCGNIKTHSGFAGQGERPSNRSQSSLPLSRLTRCESLMSTAYLNDVVHWDVCLSTDVLSLQSP